MIRTNPRLTTNIKIVADSKNKIYLESINADPLLSKSIYKGYEISYNGSYSYDLKRFYSQNGNLLPADIAYTVYEEDASLEIKNRYNNQYDFTYGAGFSPKNSKLYTEEFSLFAPLWIEADNIPEYFAIFKMDGPVTINTNDSNITELDNSAFLNDLIENPSHFFENYVQKAKLIKTFDLTTASALGTYIRNHVNDSKFPESSLYASLESGNQTYWNGFSYKNGGFCSIANDIYKDYVLVDKTITESDDFITSGFQRNGVVCANALNLEFLFDDNEQKEYHFSRYFGMYVSAVELGKFIIDNDRLYNDRDNESSQIPRPTINNIGLSTNNTTSQIQYNDNGIKIYPNMGASGPYSGRLLTFSELQNPRLAYVKDAKSNLYTIDNVTDWATINTYPATGPGGDAYSITDTNFIRVKNDKIDWSNFSGYETPFDYIPSIPTDLIGRPGMAFKIVSPLSSGDEIRIQYTDWTNPKEYNLIDTHTIKGDSSISPGIVNGLNFSTNGTFKQIAAAIAKAINNMKNYQSDIDGNYTIFSAIAKDDMVIIFSRVTSENWNRIKVTLFSDASIFPFDISDQYEDVVFRNDYQPSPVATSGILIGNFTQTNLYGGNNNPKSRASVEKDKILEFRDSNDLIYVKTNKGFDTTGGYGLYLEEPVFGDDGTIIDFKNVDKYYTVNLSDTSNNIEFGSSNKLALYKLSKNSCGYLSIYPIRDFDFRFKSEEYNVSGDSDVNKLWNWYQGATGPKGEIPLFDWPSIGATSQNLINNVIGPSSSFVQNGEFQKLIGYLDEFTDVLDPITNEYDRLKEIDISELALSSRVVPFINKWVYDNDSTNVREVPYRLNTSPAFGYSNFSPAFDSIERTPKFFTHEWYYLQKYPPYMSFDERLASFSYFDEDLYFPLMPDIGATGALNVYAGLTGGTGASANLLSVNEDYFLSYFTRESINGFGIKRDFKYSIFGIGDNIRPAESMFRGAKVEIKDKSDATPINYNKESLKYIYNERYNGYKFSAVLTYGNSGTQITCIKNDKFKSVALVIQANIDDITTKYKIGATGATASFIDRGLLYCMNDQLKSNPGGTALEYTDKVVSGLIYNWVDDGSSFVVFGKIDANGNVPQFSNELTLNENGAYNDLTVTSTLSGVTYTFKGISRPEGNNFSCAEILNLPLMPSPLLPNGSNGYAQVVGVWTPPAEAIYSEPFKYNPVYDNGGDRAYTFIMDQISFSSIANAINNGDPEIRYINVKSDGSVEFNTYTMDIAKPDYPIGSTYLKRQAIEKTPADLQINAPILGYTIGALDRVSLNNMCRYRGLFNPKFEDIINFIDTDDLKNEDLDYSNIQIFTQIPNTFTGGTAYYSDNSLGKLKELYSNKINVENPNVILSSFNSRISTSTGQVYPLIGQIAIDNDDLFIFKSNWDINYYKKYLKPMESIYVIGTREPKEEKSFFGSKTISIPNIVSIETFPNGTLTDQQLIDLGSINNTSVNIIQKTVTTQSTDNLELDIYVTKALQDWLLTDGFGIEFYKYINPNYSFGDYGLDDDIKTYIKENIFDRYSIKEITFWEKTWNPIKNEAGPDQIVTNLTDVEKLANGYIKTKNFRTIFDTLGGLDFKLIYTIPKDRRTTISFSVVLEKK